MKLSDYIKQNPAATLQDVNDFFILNKITKNNAINHDSKFNLEPKMQAVVDNESLEDSVRGHARVFIKILNGVLDEINMSDESSNEAIESLRASGVYTTEMYTHLMSLVKYYPFKGVKQEDFDACKLAYSELTTHELDWDGRKTHLKITLHEDLYEPVNVTTFYTDAIYTTPENLGRPKRLHKAGEYIIDLTNVRKTGKLFVNFNIKANATCELV